MLKRYWGVIYLAIGLSAGPVFGQQEPSGVSSEGPRIEEHESGQADGDQSSPSYPPIRVLIEESPEAAAHASEREAKTDRHEASDLSAQWAAADGSQRAAASAERQEIPAWVQLFLAIIGTVIAVTAVIASILTALRQDDTARKQLRAYVLLDGVEMEDSNGQPEFTAFAKNSGQTPAYNLRYRIGITSPEPKIDMALDDTKEFAIHDLGAGQRQPMTILFADFRGNIQTGILTGRDRAWLHGVIVYKDVFGVKRHTWFKSVIGGEPHPTVPGQYIITLSGTGDGNHST